MHRTPMESAVDWLIAIGALALLFGVGYAIIIGGCLRDCFQKLSRKPVSTDADELKALPAHVQEQLARLSQPLRAARGGAAIHAPFMLAGTRDSRQALVSPRHQTPAQSSAMAPSPLIAASRAAVVLSIADARQNRGSTTATERGNSGAVVLPFSSKRRK